MDKRYTGILIAFFETGCEGQVWMLQVDPEQQSRDLLHDCLVPLDNGDRLKVTAPDGTIVFDGVIRTDYAQGWTEYPLNPGYGQPAALGYWIHWTQHGWNPDEWARLFMRKRGEPRYRAELITCTEEERRVAPRPIPPPGVTDEDWND